jgi:tetratricopeptide (TPR) repeat protein
LEEVTIWDINSTKSLLAIASEVLAGELAAKEDNYDNVIAHLTKAVELEDGLNYDEPADWSTPVRQYLGAVLLEANRPREAEKAYREDLAIYPDNGWSLYGLAQSLRAQGKDKEAQEVERIFKSAWQYADVKLVTSRF